MKWKLYVIGILVVLVVGACVWRIARYDYRQFQRLYRVKLPRMCWVWVAVHDDMVVWGRKRYRHMRKDNGKDRRYSINFLWTYPTIIYVNSFKVTIWNMDKAQWLFRIINPYMKLPVRSYMFNPKLRGNLYRQFRGREAHFVIHIAKLFEYFGYVVEIAYDQRYNLLMQTNGNVYLVKIVFERRPVRLNDVRLPKSQTRWIVVTWSYFDDPAYLYCVKNNIDMLDGKRIDMSLDMNRLVFYRR